MMPRWARALACAALLAAVWWWLAFGPRVVMP